MEPDTNQVVEPRNRRERRARGFTSSKIKKDLVKAGYISKVPAMQPPVTGSLLFLNPEEYVKRDKARDYSRRDGNPRRWEVAKAERKARR